MSPAPPRLTRLLSLVPYLLARPGMEIRAAAEDFGVTTKQLRQDLELLWMCGLPGYGPGDLIDLSFDEDTVTVTFDAGLRRPLRLSPAEGTALLVALRALTSSLISAGTSGSSTAPHALVRATAKLEQVMGEAAPVAIAEHRDERSAPDSEIARRVEQAVSEGRVLRIVYYTASRDAVSRRDVEPRRVVLAEGRSYLEAWCRMAEDRRIFRIDRIDDAQVLQEKLTDQHLEREAQTTWSPGNLLSEESELPEAVLRLHPRGRWVAEYYPVRERTELPGGGLRIRMAYVRAEWLVRFVLGLGGQARLEAPVELAEQVQQRAAAALAGYEDREASAP